MSRIDSIDLDRGARRLAGRVGIAALVILGAPPGHAAELADVDGWIQIETDHFSVYSSASQSNELLELPSGVSAALGSAVGSKPKNAAAASPIALPAA